jgi:hypothetical protein
MKWVRLFFLIIFIINVYSYKSSINKFIVLLGSIVLYIDSKILYMPIYISLVLLISYEE